MKGAHRTTHLRVTNVKDGDEVLFRTLHEVLEYSYLLYLPAEFYEKYRLNYTTLSQIKSGKTYKPSRKDPITDYIRIDVIPMTSAEFEKDPCNFENIL